MPTHSKKALLFLLIVPMLLGAWSMRPSIAAQYRLLAQTEAASHPTPEAPALLHQDDLKPLPAPVRRYVAQSGALGKPIPWCMRIEFDAVMRKKPGDKGMQAVSQQINYFDAPTRSFYMQARMFGLPVAVLHHYAGAEASMQVKVAGLFYAVDIKGHDLFKAECVTVLNDWCLFAPGRLTDKALAWKAIDAKSAEVAFTNQGLTVKAVLHFNEKGELVDFVSDDRLALQDDGSLKRYRFSTPISDYQDFGGMRFGRKGDAVWHYPEGDFAYGSFVLKKVDYNVR